MRGLIWRSHLDRLQFSAEENRHLGEDIEAAGGVCLRDMRVRAGGSHHQKFVVLRHPAGPNSTSPSSAASTCATAGATTPSTSATRSASRWRRSTAPGRRGTTSQLAITGPAVADVETVFRERWDDPQPLTRNPAYRIADLVRHDTDEADRRALPPPLPAPEPTGTHSVQLLRTYAYRRAGYPFAPRGERSVARGYTKALKRARRLIYLEDQYLWSHEIAQQIAGALRRYPELRLIAVVPHFPDQDGRALPPNIVGRNSALDVINAVAPDRVAVYGVENHTGTPVYVHAKVCVIDDAWATVGSDNFNRRSWTHDSELTAAVLTRTNGRAPSGRRTRSRPRCARRWCASTSTSRRTTRSTSTIRWRCSPRSAPRLRRCRSGTTAGRTGRDRRAGCAPSRRRRCRAGPDCGPGRCAGSSTTRTAGPAPCAAATPTDCAAASAARRCRRGA